jgi:hypothetical protein
MGTRNTQAILTPVKITAATAGGHDPVDIKDYKGNCDFQIFGKNDAGTNPTLDIKLQHSDIALSGLSYVVADDTATADTELREGATTNVKIAATITTTTAIQVESIALVLKKNGTVSTTDLTLTIEGDSSGDPDETAIGTATVSTDDIGTSYTEYIFTFSSPIELAAATIYHLVLASDYTASGTNNIAWQFESGLTTGGNQITFDNTNYTADADDSQVFNLYEYSFSDVTGGSFDQVTTTGAVQGVALDIGSFKRYLRAFSAIGGTSSPAFYSGVGITGFKEV